MKMADTQWADVSEFQVPVNDSYPWNFFEFRSNDGNHKDNNFGANRAWSDRAVAAGKLFGYIVYYFYRPAVDGAAVLRSQVGTPNPRMVAMIDVESAGGEVSGDQSATINQQFNELASWLGDARRVIGYGNVSDLDTLWPQKPAGARLIIAAYGSNPSYPGRFAHQYDDKLPCAPFGPADANSADNMDQAALEQMFGFSAPATTSPWEDDVFIKENDGTVYQLVYGGAQSYWRSIPANAAGELPAGSVINDSSGAWLALWQVGSRS
jgi:hypothetical protein